MKFHRALLSLGLLAAALPLLAATRPPNVIIFLMDDMGYGDVQALNPEGSGFATPNLDTLVAAGTTFTEAHSSASVCAPTRYALLTGNHVYRGLNDNGTWSHFEGSQILPGQETLADMLRGVGYHTAFFGKAHLGSTYLRADGSPAESFDEADLTRPFREGPLAHGFDYSLTLPAGIQSEPYAFFQNDRLSRWNEEGMNWESFDSDAEARKHFRPIEKGPKKSVYTMDNWSTETVGPLLMRDALGFIDRHLADHGADKPFFIHYCSQAGHSPYAPPVAFNPSDPMNTTDLDAPGAVAIKGQTINKRTDMILEADVALGLFIEKLRAHGILEDTLILFTSDNGAAVGPASSWTDPVYQDVKDASGYGGDRIEVKKEDPTQVHRNAQGIAHEGRPLRGEKGFVYEGGHRIPFILRWDNGISAGVTVSNQLIALHDVYATLAAIVGAEVPADQARDSYNFSEVWQSSAEHHPLVRSSLHIQSNRPWEQNNKKVYNTWATYQATQTGDGLDLWKAVLEYNTRTEDGRAKARGVELFHLSSDPSEGHPLDQPERLETMTKSFRTASQQARTSP